ncbi:MAG: exosortase A [Aquabacterium sp.]|uniref:exosortase A n=1 Tax=Aquabacterium sp. TaxID=1872578 RepID=UPI001B6DED3A|nr:exosortase A [Aquabacterium sp.]MBP7131711.1 exosortase A [Aquabacterium sp.]
MKTPAWRVPLLMLLTLWAAVLVLYWPTASAMASIWWRSDTYAHGLVVAPAALWLMWRKRAQLDRFTPRPSLLGLLCMLGAALLWLAGDLVAVNAVTQFAFMALMVASVPTLLGWRVARVLMFPLIYLFLAVPAGDFMLPQLMEWTADFTVAALRLSGIPVYREGLQFIIPSGSWSVVEACSGIRYLVASFTVGCLFAYINYQSLRKRLLFVGVSILVPLLANWLRAYLIVLLGHLSGNTLATGVDHLVYGWVFFGVVITVMFMIGARWADREPSEPVAPFEGSSALAASPARWGLGLLLALLVMALPHAMNWQLQGRVQQGEVRLQPLVAQSGWQGTSPPVEWTPAYEAANGMSHVAWRGPSGQHVGMHIAYYRAQSYERKLVSSTNVLVRSKDDAWTQVSSGSAVTELMGQALSVQRAELRAQGSVLNADLQRLVAWQFFWVDGRFTASPVKAKLFGAWQKFKGQGDDGAMVVIYTPTAHDSADAVLHNFVRDQGDALLAALRATQSRQ